MTKHSNVEKLSLSDFVIDNKPTDFCWKYISTLSQVVISKFFYKYLDYFDKEDLTSLAVSDASTFMLKVVKLNDNDNNAIKNFRNLLFTRIRNTLSNFIFRSNKLVNTEDEVLDLNIVYPKSFDIKSDLVDMDELSIDSTDSFRTISTRVWKLFLSNSSHQKYFTNTNNDNLDDWKAYSEVHNMKKPCDLINSFNDYSEDQIETLATKLDTLTGQNYFNTLYQLLGDKFIAFLDVFQEDKFNIPSTVIVKHILTDMSICDDYDKGLSMDELSKKYNRTENSIKKIIDSKEVI